MEHKRMNAQKALGAEAAIALKSAGQKIAVLTAYDYPSARLLEEAGVDWILVGDSLGMVVLGYPDTTHVTMADMLHHTTAAARGLSQTPLIADLPIHTYDSPEDAVRNARALLHAGAHAVKLEGGAAMSDRIEALVQNEIPVMGHIGMLPQSVLVEGGYRIKGKTPYDSERLVHDAISLEAAGAFAMVVELVDPQAAKRITESVRVPTIGIGSGPHCDGQVLVTHDLLGAFPWFCPKFVKPVAHVGEVMREAARQFVSNLKNT
jgi:3-methyl-2-oxobutanoate hydroxymethyltransferase